MKNKTILILGDSTSMTTGMEKEMYPFHLAKMKAWATGTRIVNCSLPGFASADACAFFFNDKKLFEPLAAVIIYLGNCAAISSELRKGKYSPFRQWLDNARTIFGNKRGKTRLKNRLLHFEWNNSFNSSIEAPEDPRDYAYNLSRIISTSKHMGIPVILVRPRAHVVFPAGIGKGNFVFYKYLGIYDLIADRISIEDTRFKDALKLHENREFEKAQEAYKNILFTSGPISSNREYQNIVVNNYAVCAAEVNSFEESEYLLNLLLKERGARKEIILYNLAQIARLKGNTEEYRRRLIETYEADQSMYRIREPYKGMIDKIAAKFPNVTLIDLSFVPDDSYVDHCHPLAHIQKLIAEHIAEKLQIPQLKGAQPLKIENRLYNPEYSLGNRADFHSYFKTFAPFSSDEIKNFLSQIKTNSDVLPENIPREISTAFEYYLRHPCFPHTEDIIKACPILSSDIGRFPEYFLFRYLIPYMRAIEGTKELSRLFSAEAGLLRSSKDFLSILPDSVADRMGKNDLVIDSEYERLRLAAILQKVSTMLTAHLKQGNRIYERLKTTIFWYFRETLRFGSHSRISMRYERIPLEFMMEALAVAAVLDFKMGNKLRFEIQQLIARLEKTVQIHEDFCRQFSLERDCRNLLKQYDLALMNMAKKNEAWSSRTMSPLELESGKC